MRALLIASLLCVGCTVAAPDPQDPTSVLEHCAGEARAAYYVGGVSEEEAMAIYDRCLARGGV